MDPLLDALQAIDGAGDIIAEAESAINKGILWANMSVWSETVNVRAALATIKNFTYNRHIPLRLYSVIS